MEAGAVLRGRMDRHSHRVAEFTAEIPALRAEFLECGGGNAHAAIQFARRVGIHKIELNVLVAARFAFSGVGLTQQIQRSPAGCRPGIRSGGRLVFGGPVFGRLRLWRGRWRCLRCWYRPWLRGNCILLARGNTGNQHDQKEGFHLRGRVPFRVCTVSATAVATLVTEFAISNMRAHSASPMALSSLS